MGQDNLGDTLFTFSSWHSVGGLILVESNGQYAKLELETLFSYGLMVGGTKDYATSFLSYTLLPSTKTSL